MDSRIGESPEQYTLENTGQSQATTRQVTHLLRRTMFGVNAASLNYFKGRSISDIVGELLSPATTVLSFPVNDYDQVGVNNIPQGSTWINAPYNEGDDPGRIGSFRKWAIGSMISQEKNILEKMILFWHNHFATQAIIGRSDFIWDHFTCIRKHALGNFRDLTRLLTTDCHMLRFLNGEENTKLAPNENFARELQELFCIGKDGGSKFNESDVKEAARVLTGWKVDKDNRRSYFNPDDHDTGAKAFSSFYNNRTINGKQGPGAGEAELEELLDILFEKEELALFICRKLYRWFVHHDINARVEEQVIKPLASVFRKNNFEIKPVLSALFNSKYFYSEEVTGSYIKSPVDFCIGLQREFAVNYHPGNYFVNYSMWQYLIESCGMMGQVYADPPAVSGWPAYYQVPGFGKLWINSSTYPKRNQYASTLVDYGVNREGTQFTIDVIQFARNLSNPSDPVRLIDESLDLLYAVPVSEKEKSRIRKEILLSGQESDHYWPEAWDTFIANESNQVYRGTVEQRLKNLYRYILCSPEYQLS